MRIVILSMICSLFVAHSSYSQNVGIGTTTPTAQLHVNGTLRLENLPVNPYGGRLITADANGNASSQSDTAIMRGHAWLLYGNAATSQHFLGTTNNENLRIRVNNQERMMLDVNGNVGIGTSTPPNVLSIISQGNSYGAIDRRYLIWLNNHSTGNDAYTGIKLEANGSPAASPFFGTLAMVGPTYTVLPDMRNTLMLLSNTRQGLSIVSGPDDGRFESTFGKIRFYTGTYNNANRPDNIERMRIDSTGFIGIGTQVPTANLHTNGSVRLQGLTNNDALTQVLATDANGNVSWRNASTLGAAAGWGLSGNSIAAGSFIGTTNSDDFRVRVANTQRMVITTTGNVGIGSLATAPTNILSIISSETGLGPVDRRHFIWLNNTSTSVTAFAAIKLEANGSTTTGNSYGSLAMISPTYTTVPAMKSSFQLHGTTREGITIVAGPVGGIANSTYGKIRFFTGTVNIAGLPDNIERMRIDSTGFVGIGTSTPTATLHTNGTVRLQNLADGAGNALVVDANGNVFKSSLLARTAEVESLRAEVAELKETVNRLAAIINQQTVITKPAEPAASPGGRTTQ